MLTGPNALDERSGASGDCDTFRNIQYYPEILLLYRSINVSIDRWRRSIRTHQDCFGTAILTLTIPSLTSGLRGILDRERVCEEVSSSRVPDGRTRAWGCLRRPPYPGSVPGHWALFPTARDRETRSSAVGRSSGGEPRPGGIRIRTMRLSRPALKAVDPRSSRRGVKDRRPETVGGIAGETRTALS